MNSKLQVFISSTYQDLVLERQAAVEAILKSGNIPAGMELFTAGDKSQWEVIQRWISDSDIYMIILGGRYGSIEPSTGLSYTELEYDFAVSSGKPYFAVVIHEDELEKRIKTIGRSVLEKDNPDKVKDFRVKVLSKMSSFFSDHKDVKLAVLETVPQFAQEYELKGWVRATEVPDTKALADELSRLHKENKELQEKLTVQAKQIDKSRPSASASEKEFTELFDLFSNIKVDIKRLKKSYREDGSKLPNETSLLELAKAFKDVLMGGVTNESGIGETTSFVFFTICPKLQTYDIMQNEKVEGVRYRRYAVTKKGTQFFAYLEKRLHKTQLAKTTPGEQKKAVNKGKTKGSTIDKV